MKYFALVLSLFLCASGAFAQTQNDAVVFYQLKDALWNQTATVAQDSGTPGDKNGTISGTGVKFVNNGGGGSAIEYSITTNDAKIDGVTADWGEKFVLEARLKKSVLEEGGTNSEIHILKNVVTTGLDWFINTDGKMVLKVGDGSSINIISQDVVLTDDSWTTLAVAVDLSQASISDAVKFFRNGADIGSGGGGEATEPALTEVVFDEVYTAHNLKTSPIIIDNLEGDSYDYTVVVRGKSLGVVANGVIYPNGDTGSNYRLYSMYGSGTSANSYTYDSWTNGIFYDLGFGAAKENMWITHITGSSTSEKLFDSIYSCGHSTTLVRKASQYWKNTNDELTSLHIHGSADNNYNAHIRVYRTPKAATNDSWEFVETKTFSSQNLSSTPISFENLDLDADKKYKFIINADNGTNNSYFTFHPNNTSGAVTIQGLRNANGSISAFNSTGSYINQDDKFNASLIIQGDSSNKRLISVTRTKPGNTIHQYENAYWWNNTVDNLTSMFFKSNAGASQVWTGDITLYKQKDPDGVADKYNLPFEVVETVEINGDFSAGHTFSNLTGDSEFMYKVEWLGETTGPDRLDIQFNSDSSSNYDNQVLQGSTSTVSAATTNNSNLLFLPPSSASKLSSAEMYIFPKTGTNRTVLTSATAKESINRMASSWWNNSTDEITSIKVFPDSSNTFTGKLILSKIPLAFTPAQEPETPQYAEGSSIKVYDESFTNRNFNADPLVIDGLQGDNFDYEMIVKLDNNSGATSNFYTNPNEDEGANYREYYLNAQGSSAVGYTFESDNFARWGGQGGSTDKPLLAIIKFEGSSGSERIIKSSVAGQSAVNTFIRKSSFYWKNTTDEITSLLFKNQVNTITDKVHVILYAIPKSGDRGNWELVEDVTLTNRDLSANPIQFNNLDGDVDKQYRLEIALPVSSRNLGINFNGDTGSSNYVRQTLRNSSSGSISAIESTTDKILIDSSGNHTSNFSSIIINAESGSKRLTNISGSGIGGYVNNESVAWWNDTSNNLNSISLSCSQSTSQTGSVKLYKLKDTSITGDDLHWETVGEVPLNGNFSSGHDFTGLTGDSETLYKLEWIANTEVNDNINLEFTINNDTGNNYIDQELEAHSTSATASSSTRARFTSNNMGRAFETHSFEALIYPKSGSQRPLLMNWVRNRSNSTQRYIHRNGGWWDNSTDEITSINVYSTTSTPLFGKVRLSRLTDPPVVEETPVPAGQIALDASSTYTSGMYPTIFGENAIEMLTKTGDFTLFADFLKMTLKRTDGAFDSANIQIGEGYRVDANYNVLTPTSSQIFVYPPKLLRRVYNPPADFDTLGRPKAGVTVDIATSPVVSKVYYGLFQFEFALDKALSENVTVDVFMKTTDFDFKKIAEVKPTAKPADPEAPWIIKYYWNSRLNQFDWDGNAYKTSGAVEFKFEVR